MAKSESFRWHSLFQRASEPLFLLDKRCRIVFVNKAWEALTGLAADDALGLICTRRAGSGTEPADAVARALAPPPEVLDGEGARAMRMANVRSGARRWWDVEFLPLRGVDGLLGIVGKVTPRDSPAAVAAGPLPENVVGLRDGIARQHALSELASDHPAMRRVLDQVRLAGRMDAPALILGEPGTGKQWLARAIHCHGITRELSFAGLDCARLPADAVAEGLFGHAGLLSDSGIGTVYLKEPARLPLDLQARLLEWLSDRSSRSDSASTTGGARAGPRLLAGCCDLPEDEVGAGRFSESLCAALGTLTIVLPPLRTRPADLTRLVERMLAKEAGAQGGQLSEAAWNLLRAHSWPGNLRELRRVLATAREHAGDGPIDAAHLPAYLRRASGEALPGDTAAGSLSLDRLLEQVERRALVLALRLAQGNKSRAAEILGIWRPRLHRRMEALGIADPAADSEPPPTLEPGASQEQVPPAADEGSR